MPTRSERRRKDRSGTGQGAPRLPLGRTERIAVAFLATGLIIVLGAFLVSRVISGGGTDDDATIRALARRSIEVLPQGEWPSLYDDFTADFQARCNLADFTQAGVEGANNVGADLPQLVFFDMTDLSISGDTASATIIGAISGQADSQYKVEAAFAREDGRWKLAAAPDTAGCQAFNVLN